MTLPVADAPELIADQQSTVDVAVLDGLPLVAWNAGHGWTRWHIEVENGKGRTACGHEIPIAVRIGHRTAWSNEICCACVEARLVA